MDEEQKELLLNIAKHCETELPATYGRLRELFPEAFDKPERIKKVFEVELSKNSVTDLDESMVRLCLIGESHYDKSKVGSVKELPVGNINFDSGYDKKQQDAMNFKLPEREGLNVRIEWDKKASFKKEDVINSIERDYSHLKDVNFSVKEIGAGDK